MSPSPPAPDRPADPASVCLSLQEVTIRYGSVPAVRNVHMDLPRRQVTAFIGPSGCGKTTLLRAINRMNDLIPGCRLQGRILFGGENLYERSIDPVEVRRRIGMVFQKPNPFPKSVYENIAYGARIHGFRGDMDELVERSLRRAALWEETRDKLHQSGLALSGGQQQRLCIARAISTEPQVLLMDEPCSALDPLSTRRIEDLIRELRRTYTIVIVTHNMQQASRISDQTGFFNAIPTDDGRGKVGVLEEFATTRRIFEDPRQPATRDYISGRFG